MEKIKIDARVDIETVEKINQLAIDQNRTKSGMVAHILNEYVKSIPKANDYQTKAQEAIDKAHQMALGSYVKIGHDK